MASPRPAERVATLESMLAEHKTTRKHYENALSIVSSIKQVATHYDGLHHTLSATRLHHHDNDPKSDPDADTDTDTGIADD